MEGGGPCTVGFLCSGVLGPLLCQGMGTPSNLGTPIKLAS